MINLGKLLLQIVYDCNPKDRENLEALQGQIQDRINFLTEQNQDAYSDDKLLEYYELHRQIQQCLFEDHSDQYLLIAEIVAAVSVFVFIRWKMIKKGKNS